MKSPKSADVYVCGLVSGVVVARFSRFHSEETEKLFHSAEKLDPVQQWI